ncbi:MAG TPA: hypothetical protein VNE62_09560 [Actinomycetota bacterium]|nr:hypothetical protein [Actinomycetota bacterium]
MTAAADMSTLGFEVVQRRRDGAVVWSRRASPYLVYWLTAHTDGSGELTWELALGEYFRALGLTFSAQDELSLFVFPSAELRGTLDEAWVASSIEEVEGLLRSIDLVSGT